MSKNDIFCQVHFTQNTKPKLFIPDQQIQDADDIALDGEEEEDAGCLQHEIDEVELHSHHVLPPPHIPSCLGQPRHVVILILYKSVDLFDIKNVFILSLPTCRCFHSKLIQQRS